MRNFEHVIFVSGDQGENGKDFSEKNMLDSIQDGIEDTYITSMEEFTPFLEDPPDHKKFQVFVSVHEI